MADKKTISKASRLRSKLRKGEKLSSKDASWLNAYDKTITGGRPRAKMEEKPQIQEISQEIKPANSSPSDISAAPSTQVDNFAPLDKGDTNAAVAFSNEAPPMPGDIAGSEPAAAGQNGQGDPSARPSGPALSSKDGPCKVCGSRGPEANVCKGCGKDHSVKSQDLEMLFKMTNVLWARFPVIEATPDGNLMINRDKTLAFTDEEAKICADGYIGLMNHYNVQLNETVAVWIAAASVTAMIVGPKVMGIVAYQKTMKMLKAQEQNGLGKMPMATPSPIIPGQGSAVSPNNPAPNMR